MKLCATLLVILPLGGLCIAEWVDPKHTLKVASGWTAHGVANGLTSPRTLVFDKAGHLLVLQQGVGIVGFTLNVDGSVANKRTVLNYHYLNHGLSLSVDGQTLFASSENTAWKWNYNATNLQVSNQKKVVTGMANDAHVTRSVIVSNTHPNLLIVSRGSQGNIDTGAAKASSGRAQVKVFDWTNLPSGDQGWDFTSQGHLLAYGVRNDVGIAEDRAGRVWAVENSADNLVRVRNGVSTDVHQNNPGEKLNLLGDAATASSSNFYGYPYCYSVWDPASFPEDTFKVGDWFVQKPTAGGVDGAWCDRNAVKPKLLFQAHSAPLDIKFGPTNDYRAYITFHGSWDRNPPTGYKVVAVPGTTPFDAWNPAAGLRSTDGYIDILTNADIDACPGRCFRPTGIVFNSAGDRLYIASDSTGELFLLQRS